MKEMSRISMGVKRIHWVFRKHSFHEIDLYIILNFKNEYPLT